MKFLKDENLFDFIFLFIFLYVSFSKFFLEISGIIKIFTLSFALLIWMITIVLNKRLTFHKNKIFLYILLIFLIIFSIFLRGNISEWDIIVIINISFAFFISTNLNIQNFIKVYVKLMFFISFISLFLYTTNVFFSEIFSFLPDFLRFKNLFFSILPINKDSLDFYRNYSFFWEPGAYQIFLNLALFLNLFYLKGSKFISIILFVSILTTFSTSGLITLFILVGVYLILSVYKYGIFNKKIMFFPPLILLLIILFNLLPIIITREIFNRITFLIDSSSNSNISGQVRVNAFEIGINYFISNPLFGYGMTWFHKEIAVESSLMPTFTFINLFNQFGLFYGFTNIFLISKVFTKISSKLIIKSLALLFLILLFATQDFSFSPFLFLLTFYGLDKYKFKNNESSFS